MLETHGWPALAELHPFESMLTTESHCAAKRVSHHEQDVR